MKIPRPARNFHSSCSVIPRPLVRAALDAALRRNRVTALVGPRRCGKTTLVRELARESGATVFDMDDPGARKALENPRQVLEPLSGLVIIDGVEQDRDVVWHVRRIVEARRRTATFLVVSNASRRLLGSCEDLLWDLPSIEMGGLGLTEVGADGMTSLWVRGGMPQSFLALDDAASFACRAEFIGEFLERDLGRMGITVGPRGLRRLWTMAGHHGGEPWNYSHLARSLNVDDMTVRRQVEVLAETFMLRVLPAWIERTGRRQRTAPKIHHRDSGVLHALLGLGTREEILSHPIAAPSWRSFAIEQVLKLVPSSDAHHWALHTGPALDLLVTCADKRLGFEFQLADDVFWSPARKVAVEILGLERFLVVIPRGEARELDERVGALPLASVREVLKTT